MWSFLRPGPWPKEFTVCDDLHGSPQSVRGGKGARVAPPRLDGGQANVTVVWVLQAEEDHNRRDSHAGVESGGQDVVVLGPPREMTAADNVLEDEPDDCPGHIVDGRGRGDVACSGEDDREARRRSGSLVSLSMRAGHSLEVADDGDVGVLEGDGVGDRRADDADEEEVHQAVVHLAV